MHRTMQAFISGGFTKVLIMYDLYFYVTKRCIFSVTALSLTTAFSWRAENTLNTTGKNDGDTSVQK